MKVIDLHCDVLEKLTRFEDANFRNDDRLQANLERLIKGNVKLQVFAIFIHPSVPQEMKFLEVMKQIEAFHTKVLSQPEMVHITDWSQVSQLQEGQIGAILSLEGCDAIGDDLEKLDAILNAGIKLVGLTWNFENSVAYGASEDPTKGLKPFGLKVIEQLNKRNIIIDVAHLNEQGFYELLPIAKNIIASHCNSRVLCDHPRNLTDKQLKALAERGGRIHIVFYPPFIENEQNSSSIDKLIEHVEHLKTIVGIENIGFGSDFDGIDPLSVKGLENASHFPSFIKDLQTKFTEQEVKFIAEEGFQKFINKLVKHEKQ